MLIALLISLALGVIIHFIADNPKNKDKYCLTVAVHGMLFPRVFPRIKKWPTSLKMLVLVAAIAAITSIGYILTIFVLLDIFLKDDATSFASDPCPDPNGPAVVPATPVVTPPPAPPSSPV